MPTGHPLIGEPDPERLLTCPYEPSHRISRKRLQVHLTKCRKNHPNAKKEVCPFNATHMVNEQEFKFHLETCPSKGIVDTFKYVTENEAQAIELPPAPVLPPSEENWDNEYCGTYEPALKVAEAPIIHTFIGGTPSERKKCRIQQRQKFRALDETEPSIKVSTKPVKEEKLADDQPLRQPSTLPKSLANNSAQFPSLNNSFVSEVSETAQSTRIRGKSASDKMPALVYGDPWNQGIPGPSRRDDDDFIVFRSKGRGNYRR